MGAVARTLILGVEIRKIQHNVWYEASLQETQQESGNVSRICQIADEMATLACGQKGCAPCQPKLADGYDAPQHHLRHNVNSRFDNFSVNSPDWGPSCLAPLVSI